MTDSPLKRPVNLNKAWHLLSQAKPKECLRLTQQIIQQKPDQFQTYGIALQACLALEDPSEVRAIIQSGLINISTGRQKFLTNAFEVCAQFKLEQLCKQLAAEIITIAINTNQPELKIYKFKKFEILKEHKKAVRIALRLQKRHPNNTRICIELIS